MQEELIFSGITENELNKLVDKYFASNNCCHDYQLKINSSDVDYVLNIFDKMSYKQMFILSDLNCYNYGDIFHTNNKSSEDIWDYIGSNFIFMPHFNILKFINFVNENKSYSTNFAKVNITNKIKFASTQKSLLFIDEYYNDAKISEDDIDIVNNFIINFKGLRIDIINDTNSNTSLIKELPCKTCNRNNDIGVNSCWWCGANNPC